MSDKSHKKSRVSAPARSSQAFLDPYRIPLLKPQVSKLLVKHSASLLVEFSPSGTIVSVKKKNGDICPLHQWMVEIENVSSQKQFKDRLSLLKRRAEERVVKVDLSKASSNEEIDKILLSLEKVDRVRLTLSSKQYALKFPSKEEK